MVVGREVAIKVILPEYANYPDFIYRFETEAQVVARLSISILCPCMTTGANRGELTLSCVGCLTAYGQPCTMEHGMPEATAHLLDQLAAALTVAIRHGVIHRDIKPDNILLDDAFQRYLADFGIAKNLSGGEWRNA